MIAVRWEDILRVAALALLVGCILVSVVTLIEQAVQVWDGTYLVPLGMLVAVEAMVSYAISRGRPPWFRAGELIALFVIVEMVVDVADGFPPFAYGSPQFDPRSAGILFLLAPIWIAATNVAAVFRAIDRPPSNEPRFVSPLRRLAVRLLGGGVALFVVAALTQTTVARDLHLTHPSSSGPLTNVFLYFLLSILLLGHVQYTLLQQRWRAQNVTVPPGFGERWLRYSFIFVALVAAGALLFPTIHLSTLLEPGRTAWTELVTVLRGPLTWLVTVLKTTARPFRPDNLPTPTVLPKFPPLHSPPKIPQHGGHGIKVAWLPLLRALVFWGLVAAGAIYLLRSVRFRRPHGTVPTGFLSQLLASLGSMWERLRSWLRKRAGAIADRLPHQMRRKPRSTRDGEREALGQRPRGSRSPREQIMRYFLTVVRRAERSGMARRRSETPYEFSAVLSGHLTEAQVDLALLTGAFVEARYSPHEVGQSEAEAARSHWQRIRQAFQQVKG